MPSGLPNGHQPKMTHISIYANKVKEKREGEGGGREEKREYGKKYRERDIISHSLLTKAPNLGDHITLMISFPQMAS